MRKLSLIIILLVCYNWAFAQKAVTTGQLQFSLPLNTQKLTERQFIKFAKARFNDSVLYGTAPHLYRSGNVLFSYRKLKTQPKLQKPIESREKIVVNVLMSDKLNVLERDTLFYINNIKVAVLEYHKNDVGELRFVTDWGKDGSALIGFVQYKVSDTALARNYFDKIVQSIK